jgi:PPOX class probable F420-dependent enzyme
MTDSTPAQPSTDTLAQPSADSPAAVPIPDSVRAFLDDIRFATISTIDPDGMPRPAVIWYTVDGDGIIINSRVGRRWPTNLLRDPRMSFTVLDSVNEYRWVGMTGTATPTGDAATAQADIAGMARRYRAIDPAGAERAITGTYQRQERISFRFRPLSIYDYDDR